MLKYHQTVVEREEIVLGSGQLVENLQDLSALDHVLVQLAPVQRQHGDPDGVLDKLVLRAWPGLIYRSHYILPDVNREELSWFFSRLSHYNKMEQRRDENKRKDKMGKNLYFLEEIYDGRPQTDVAT